MNPTRLANRLEDAVSLHVAGHLQQAEAAYLDILRTAPGHTPAVYHLGLLLHQTKRSEEGIDLVRQALNSAAMNSDWHNSLGNMYVDVGREEEAVASYLAALEIDARHALAWNNLGAVLLRRGQPGDAILAFKNALIVEPAFGDAWHNLADAFSESGDARAAATCRCEAYVLHPAPDKPPHMLGLAYRILGRLEDAVKVYETWLEESPGNPIATHLLLACRNGEPPGRASDAYLEQYFDEYCETFEQRLSGLHYAVPEAIGEALEKLAIRPLSLRAMDAGCGTGLCAPYLSMHARHMTGVDLSSRSLALARTKGLYDALHQCEIVTYMRSSPKESFDLVVAADTLIYFGDIAEFLYGASHVLTTGGLLIASFQELQAPEGGQQPQGDFSIEPNGRFSHRKDFLTERYGAAGFAVSTIVPLDIRLELGVPVKGLLMVASKR